MNVIEGKLIGKNIKVGIVVTRFNEFITSNLLSGSVDTLVRHDVDIIITLGCVMRGATTHYDYVCNEVAKGVASVG